jgi:hypothetical protein
MVSEDSAASYFHWSAGEKFATGIVALVSLDDSARQVANGTKR